MVVGGDSRARDRRGRASRRGARASSLRTAAAAAADPRVRDLVEK